MFCKHLHPSLEKDYGSGGSGKNLQEFCYGAGMFSADIGAYLIQTVPCRSVFLPWLARFNLVKCVVATFKKYMV